MCRFMGRCPGFSWSHTPNRLLGHRDGAQGLRADNPKPRNDSGHGCQVLRENFFCVWCTRSSAVSQDPFVANDPHIIDDDTVCSVWLQELSKSARYVRDVITLFLFILMILFLWSLMSISSLTWLWGAFVNDYALFFHIGPVTVEHLGLWLEISTRFKVWNQTFTDGDAGKTAVFLFFPVRLWDCTAGLHKEGCYSQWCNTYLSRIDRIFVNLPVAEARDFHCYSHVFENLGERFIPWLHRFKLPNLAGNLSPRVEEGG